MIQANKNIIEEVAKAIEKGNIALWIGKESDISDDPVEALLNISWLGVWLERTNQRFANALVDRWNQIGGNNSARFIREVPKRVVETLGTYFSFVDVCPIFYLNGIGSEWESRSPRENRRDRDEKTDILEKIEDAVLIVEGVREVGRIVEILNDELGGQTEELRVLFVGVKSEDVSKVYQSATNRSEKGRIRFTTKSLKELIEGVGKFQFPASNSPFEIIIDGKPHSILRELRRENPIDQYFDVLTSNHLAPLKDDPTSSDLSNFLRGTKSAYPFLRHKLHWRRNTDHLSALHEHVSDFWSANKRSVCIFNAVCEPGSGATTLLQEVAVKYATEGHPSLFRHSYSTTVDYDTLRVFLENLPDAKRRKPPVIVFDTIISLAKTEDDVSQLASKLARDGQNCLLIRGISFSESDELATDTRKLLSLKTRNSRFEESWIPGIVRSRLLPDEQESLHEWSVEHFGEQSGNRLKEVLADWENQNSNPPFLIYLYFVLQNELEASTELGRQLFDRARPVLDEAAKRNTLSLIHI